MFIAHDLKSSSDGLLDRRQAGAEILLVFLSQHLDAQLRVGKFFPVQCNPRRFSFRTERLFEIALKLLYSFMFKLRNPSHLNYFVRDLGHAQIRFQFQDKGRRTWRGCAASTKLMQNDLVPFDTCPLFPV